MNVAERLYAGLLDPSIGTLSLHVQRCARIPTAMPHPRVYRAFITTRLQGFYRRR